MAAPGSDQVARLFAHRHRHLDRALRRVGTRHGIVEEHHDAITRELIKRALILTDQRPQCAMVLAQEIQYFLGLGGLSEGGVAAQIAEHDDDLAAMAFQDFLIALRDDQFGELRCKEPFQSSDPAQLVDLLRYPRL